MHKRELNPVAKLFFAALYRDGVDFERAAAMLSERFGPADFVSRPFDFDETDYYRSEMGDGLKRSFISFEGLVSPSALVPAKLFAEEAEALFSRGGGRAVNLDPGYVDFAKVVLASFKAAPHKLYLSDGVYADLTLLYSKGAFRPFDWTFPDFRSGRYHASLLRMRDLYKERLRKNV